MREYVLKMTLKNLNRYLLFLQRYFYRLYEFIFVVD
ncbi:MAG: hypothetical protein ACI815_002343 [Psychroserpens sp.]|jgi:hypothetical protein